MNRIPADARISIVQDRQITPPELVREQYKKVKPLEQIPVEKRGWMLEVLNVVRKLDKTHFTNSDVYAFEAEFKRLHPENNLCASPSGRPISVSSFKIWPAPAFSSMPVRLADGRLLMGDGAGTIQLGSARLWRAVFGVPPNTFKH